MGTNEWAGPFILLDKTDRAETVLGSNVLQYFRLSFVNWYNPPPKPNSNRERGGKIQGQQTPHIDVPIEKKYKDRQHQEHNNKQTPTSKVLESNPSQPPVQTKSTLPKFLQPTVPSLSPASPEKSTDHLQITLPSTLPPIPENFNKSTFQNLLTNYSMSTPPSTII